MIRKTVKEEQRAQLLPEFYVLFGGLAQVLGNLATYRLQFFHFFHFKVLLASTSMLCSINEGLMASYENGSYNTVQQAAGSTDIDCLGKEMCLGAKSASKTSCTSMV